MLGENRWRGLAGEELAHIAELLLLLLRGRGRIGSTALWAFEVQAVLIDRDADNGGILAEQAADEVGLLARFSQDLGAEIKPTPARIVSGPK